MRLPHDESRGPAHSDKLRGRRWGESTACRGVYRTHHDRYVAKLRLDGVLHTFGTFATLAEAQAAHAAGEARLLAQRNPSQGG